MTANEYKKLYDLLLIARKDTSDSNGSLYEDTGSKKESVRRDENTLMTAASVAHERYLALKYPDQKTYPS